jgi:cell division protein FtsL
LCGDQAQLSAREEERENLQQKIRDLERYCRVLEESQQVLTIERDQWHKTDSEVGG